MAELDPNVELQNLILSEVRSAREETKELSAQVTGRLYSLESKMDTLIGGDRPGRIDRIEEDLDALQASKNRFAGGIAVLSSIGGGLVVLLQHLFHLIH